MNEECRMKKRGGTSMVSGMFIFDMREQAEMP